MNVDNNIDMHREGIFVGSPAVANKLGQNLIIFWY